LRAAHADLKSALALLPLAQQIELHDEALRGILVKKAGDLMYWWNLRRAFQSREKRMVSDGFFR